MTVEGGRTEPERAGLWPHRSLAAVSMRQASASAEQRVAEGPKRIEALGGGRRNSYEEISSFGMIFREEEDAAFVVLSGELDLTCESRVESGLALLEARRPTVLTIDLRGLEFMDATGLGLLLAAQRRARDEGRRLIILAGSGPARRVLRTAGVEGRLELVDDPEEPGL